MVQGPAEFFPQKIMLPCFNCTANSICCSFGVFLEDYEALVLLRLFGEAAISWNIEENNWRTSCKNGRCFFFQGRITAKFMISLTILYGVGVFQT